MNCSFVILPRGVLIILFLITLPHKFDAPCFAQFIFLKPVNITEALAIAVKSG